MVRHVPGSAEFRKGAALAYSSRPEASSLLFWVFLDVSPIWPEASILLCSTHCQCGFVVVAAVVLWSSKSLRV